MVGLGACLCATSAASTESGRLRPLALRRITPPAGGRAALGLALCGATAPP